MQTANNQILILILFLASCASTKSTQIQEIGDRNVAVENSIADFSSTNDKSFRTNNVFAVMVDSPVVQMKLIKTENGNEEWVADKSFESLVGVGIIASKSKFVLMDSLGTSGKLAKIPTRLIEKDGKLFYWWDDSYSVTSTTIAVLRKYDLLVNYDLEGVNEVLDFSIDDVQKSTLYFICKNDMRNYRRIVTNKALGYFDIPKVDCAQ